MMRKVLLLMASLATFSGWSQAPPRMSFQAVIRDAGQALVTGTTVGVRLSVLQGSAQGPAVYEESHQPVTNANGLATMELGGGAVQSGSIGSIDWSQGPYFLRQEVDPLGGTAYTISGTSELLSVPYALHAANNLPGPPGPPGPPGMPGASGCDPNVRDSLIVLYNNAMAYGFHQDANGNGAWVMQALGNTGHANVASKRAVVIHNNSMAYAFHLDNAGQGQWVTHPLGNTIHTSVSSDRAIVLYNNSTAHGFHVDGSGSGVWTSQPLGNTNHSSVAHGGKIVVWNNSTAYAFAVDASGNGTWTTQPIGGTTHTVVTTR